MRSACICFKVRRCLRDVEASALSHAANLSANGVQLAGSLRHRECRFNRASFQILPDGIPRQTGRARDLSDRHLLPQGQTADDIQHSHVDHSSAPVAQSAGGRVTWVNSQGKKAAFLGQCRVEIHSTADDIPDTHLVRWSIQEIRRIASRMAQRQIQPASIVAWSIWRRAHQAVAKCPHNKEIWNSNAKIMIMIYHNKTKNNTASGDESELKMFTMQNNILLLRRIII